MSRRYYQQANYPLHNLDGLGDMFWGLGGFGPLWIIGLGAALFRNNGNTTNIININGRRNNLYY